LSPLHLVESAVIHAVEAGLPFTALVRRAPREPVNALRVAWSIVKGYWYKWTYPLRGVRFSAGRNFRVQGRLKIQGPGRVVFGDNVVVGAHTTPWTHHRDAIITVGNDTFLNGTRFGARSSITIGPRCILAEAHILDTDFHSIEINRRDPRARVRTAPVQIGENVWIAAQAGILPGARIGRNSVVGFGAVCTGEYPANCVIAGNPARVIRQLTTVRGAVG
jgi:acetyltransferase-like isoleucine patch superfamily enzyme